MAGYGSSGRFCGQGATLWCRNPLLSPNELTYGDYMNMKRFVVNVTAACPPDRTERAILGLILAVPFLVNSGRICGQGTTQ